MQARCNEGVAVRSRSDPSGFKREGEVEASAGVRAAPVAAEIRRAGGPADAVVVDLMALHGRHRLARPVRHEVIGDRIELLGRRVGDLPGGNDRRDQRRSLRPQVRSRRSTRFDRSPATPSAPMAVLHSEPLTLAQNDAATGQLRMA